LEIEVKGLDGFIAAHHFLKITYVKRLLRNEGSVAKTQLGN